MNTALSIVSRLQSLNEKKPRLLLKLGCDIDDYEKSNIPFSIWKYVNINSDISYYYGLTKMALVPDEGEWIVKLPSKGFYRGEEFNNFIYNYCEIENDNYTYLKDHKVNELFAKTIKMELGIRDIVYLQEKCIPWSEMKKDNISISDVNEAIKMKKMFKHYNEDITLPYIFIAEMIKAYGKEKVEKMLLEATFYIPDLLKDMNEDNFGYRVSDGTPCIFDFACFKEEQLLNKKGSN